MSHADDAFDAALRQHLHDQPEPDDAGFSLRVMAQLARQDAKAAQSRARRHARVARGLRWVAISLAALGLATLASGRDPLPDLPHMLAALSLLVLMLLWSLPNRWGGR